MKKNLYAALCLALLLSACTVGPDFKPPEAPADTVYTGADEAASNETGTMAPRQLQDDWWLLFASQDLNDTIIQAIAGNKELASAQETLQQANEAVIAEQGALMPQVGFDAMVGRQKYGVAVFGPTGSSFPPFTYYETGPSASWSLDIFGRNKRSIERQKALAEYQRQQTNAAYVNLTGNVAAQALEMAAAKAEIAATQRIIDEDRKTLKLVEASFEGGAGTRVDIMSAQSQLRNDEALLPSLRQRVSAARHALAILAGVSPSDWTPPDFTLKNFNLPPRLPVSLPSEMAHQRPDILAAEANLHAASAAIGIATANMYPDVTLSANMLQEALTPAGLFKAESNAWAMAAGLTAPIFSGGTLSAEKRAAEHAYKAALSQYEQTVLSSFGEVADALTALDHDVEAIRAQQQAVDTADNSLTLARKSYEAGNTGLLQLQDATRQLAQAQLGLIRSKSQRLMDTTKLFVALGGSPVKSRA